MPGSKIGGMKTRDINLAKNPNYYKIIGAMGGSYKHPSKGFGGNKEMARAAGKAGGLISRRNNIKTDYDTKKLAKAFEEVHKIELQNELKQNIKKQIRAMKALQ